MRFAVTFVISKGETNQLWSYDPLKPTDYEVRSLLQFSLEFPLKISSCVRKIYRSVSKTAFRGNESFTSSMEILQAELSQNQVFSQQEIEQLSCRYGCCRKMQSWTDFVVWMKKEKVGDKEDRLNRQLDAAQKKL